MREELKIEIPKGFMNTAITIDGHLTADTNNSANWDTIKIPLPKGKWVIRSIWGKEVILENMDLSSIYN